MRRTAITLLASCALLSGALLSSASAHPPHLAPCEPGFQWMEVTEYKEVCRDVCKVVPDVKTKKKWVYSTVEDPFCIHRTGHKHPHDCGPGCPTCKGPYQRNQLVKREVVCEEPTTKCVVEKVVEHVPCKVWRKVPCGTVVAAPPAAK